ncbi:hypothetical protein HU200_024887 [Digitaria exilis]|uniref:DUF6598 domain-containing protein n=1 Tax=Digitaria exilis TaxID=1010633 RepID=A0A835EWG5_9POAL|nr:hypothetical protein HU200_024887 [Digitaria exilis]
MKIESPPLRNDDLVSEWCDIANSKTTPRPVFPLPVFPSVTPYCVSGYKCYHVRYLTGNTSETTPEHPYFMPCEMMQVFSVGLSSPLTHPIDIYGWFSVRDDWEPLRNYLFKRSRDDPAMNSEGCSFLPLRSPCRGIYVSQYFLMDVELCIKDDGERSADKLLFRGYVEFDTSSSGVDSVPRGRIETVIEVKAEAKQPSDVRISALTSGFDKEISLYNGKLCASGLMFKHVMAVNKQEELHVVLKVHDSSYKWTFKAGIGVVVAPEHPISGFAQYFVMNVSFRTRGKAASASQWSCICNDVHISKTHL